MGDSAICTINNNDIAPTITLHKVVVNNDGGTLQAADFSLQIGGTTVAQDTVLQQTAGVALDIDELQVQGYLPTGVSCTSNLGLDANAAGTAAITLTPQLAENVSCTITNDDVRPGLTVVKNVVNDNGGNAVVGDFVLQVNGSQVISGEPKLYGAGTPLVVSEVQVTGYVATGTVCVSDLVESNNSVTLPGGTATITLTPGEAVLCTITNDDQAPTITVIKNVVNDDGRGAVVSDFPLFVGLSAVTSGVAQIVDANQSYTVGETQQDGYALTSLTCVNSAGTLVTNPVVPNEGDRIICTLVNDDTPITDLQIVKTTSTPAPLVGTIVTYTLTVSNNGPSSAHDVSVVDPMPAPLVLDSVSSADFTCSSANNTITCTRPLLLAGQVGTITVTALVPLTAVPGSNLQNVATVSTVTPETTLANNQSSVSVSPFAAAVLPVVPPVVELPRTGIDVGLLVRFAALFAAAGVFAVGVSRRRRRDRDNVAY